MQASPIRSLSLLRFAFAALLTALCGCNSNQESKTLSYDFTVNGCPTEKQTFSDEASLCAGLKDDARNHFCAKAEREKEYANRCQPTPAAAPTTPAPAPSLQKSSGLNNDGKSPGNLRVPTEPFGSIPPQSPGPSEGDALSRLTLVTLLARPIDRLTVSPQTSGSDMITSLSGKLAVEFQQELFGRKVDLMGATTVTFMNPALGDCQLSTKNFSNPETSASSADSPEKKQVIAFSLVGIDSVDRAGQNGCLVKLSTMAMTGFSVEFENVRLGGPLSTIVVPKVRLDVANQ